MFDWIRNRVRQAVLGGVEDALAQLEADRPATAPALPQGLADRLLGTAAAGETNGHAPTGVGVSDTHTQTGEGAAAPRRKRT